MQVQARFQGAQSAQGQVGIERRGGQAQAVSPVFQPFVDFRRFGHYRSADHIAVAVDVLGGRVDDDIGTKQEVYDMIAAEARAGRTFIWYTTEIEELSHCDRAYVFRNGAITASLGAGQLSEEQVLQASFAESSS